MTDKKYINGVFIQMFDGQYGDFISIGITDEGLEELAALPKNEKGVRNFASFKRKGDERKFNPMWPKESSSRPSSRPQEKGMDDGWIPPREDAPPVGKDDTGLPF